MVNISTPLVISVKENSVLAYRAAEQYYSTYSKQAGLFLEKNVFTGNCDLENLQEFFCLKFSRFLITNSSLLSKHSNHRHHRTTGDQQFKIGDK
jgi:hypothetical protein